MNVQTQKWQNNFSLLTAYRLYCAADLSVNNRQISPNLEFESIAFDSCILVFLHRSLSEYSVNISNFLLILIIDTIP